MEKDKLLEKMYHNNNELNIDRLGCKMFLAAFKNDDIHKGLQKALFFAKMFTQASDVILYKMDNYQNAFQHSFLSICIRHQHPALLNHRHPKYQPAQYP